MHSQLSRVASHTVAIKPLQPGLAPLTLLFLSTLSQPSCFHSPPPHKHYSIFSLSLSQHTTQVIFWGCDVLLVVFVIIVIIKLLAEQHGVVFGDLQGYYSVDSSLDYSESKNDCFTYSFNHSID